MKKFAVTILILLLPFPTFSAERRVSSQLEIEKIISAIPVTDKDFGYRNIGERMENLGMHVESVRVDLVTKEDAEPPIFLAGDQLIKIATDEPNKVVTSMCQILGSPSYVKRGKNYIPQNRTAYWLMHNRCDFK